MRNRVIFLGWLTLLFVLALPEASISQKKAKKISARKVQIEGGEKWKDYSTEMEQVREDFKNYQDFQDDKAELQQFKSSLYDTDPNENSFYEVYGLFNSREYPIPEYLSDADYLVYGDVGAPLKLKVGVRNRSDELIRIEAIDLIVDDFSPEWTSRGSAAMELESLNLLPEQDLVLFWPQGFQSDSREFHYNRRERGEPLRRAMGYNTTRLTLTSPITVPAGEVTDVEFEITTEPYKELGFGASHFLAHIEFQTSKGVVATKKIYIVGSQWWMFPE